MSANPSAVTDFAGLLQRCGLSPDQARSMARNFYGADADEVVRYGYDSEDPEIPRLTQEAIRLGQGNPSNPEHLEIAKGFAKYAAQHGLSINQAIDELQDLPPDQMKAYARAASIPRREKKYSADEAFRRVHGDLTREGMNRALQHQAENPDTTYEDALRKVRNEAHEQPQRYFRQPGEVERYAASREYQEGYSAGKSASQRPCPYTDTQARADWLQGYREGAAYAGWKPEDLPPWAGVSRYAEPRHSAATGTHVLPSEGRVWGSGQAARERADEWGRQQDREHRTERERQFQIRADISRLAETSGCDVGVVYQAAALYQAGEASSLEDGLEKVKQRIRNSREFGPDCGIPSVSLTSVRTR